MTCNCDTSEYKYNPVGHVVTGDLQIVKDCVLRQLLRKGPTFREPNNINWELNRKICRMAVAKYKEKWCKKESIDKHVLDEWEHTVYSYIDGTIEYLKQNNTVKRKKHILKKKRHLVNLEHIQGEYVLVPADKAANNICKKYYNFKRTN